MAKHYVLRMRRELSEPIEVPVWPADVTFQTLGAKPDKKHAKAAHSVLESGFWEGGGGAPIFPRWWKALRKDSEFDPALVFLAFEGNEVIGMAQCWTSAFVKDLAIHPRARKRGIGRALMLTAFDAFAKRGAAYVDLKVREENETAQRLYTSLRMRIVSRDAE
ncbi:MAG TPA: GNAT family N-acetyltransferase [Hyphomonadaceae bacterium]|jgi:ribosomal protein S18 acetylase RimI-like enzyme|nr:GNAT family N-acetyltransferase [Hyphomonadaceae bacterium]HPN06939.1 GNAT family N-acetyltransferase [Hyphomonadaceae bacterium]